MRPIILTIFGMLLLTSCKEELQRPHTPPPEGHMEKRAPVFHTSHEPTKADAPFSDAVQVGDIYFLSGQIGIDQSTRTLVTGGIEAETKQALENIKAVLAHHNLEMTDVVKAMVVLDDIEDFATFNAIYKSYLPQKPARTTFAAKALAAGAKIEIEVIAVRKK
ncbi:endoribonuclease L-PSP [Dokdonia sp. MED134]|uniref:Rid family detoxifying hydrolase n=1 Tax=Dokdonia sp. MED134 TaxID=313590 RepID=UPI0001F814C7|nr:Rid family detoxifying hydrolase [Dokdonia sp. MED134]EAQ40069.2 endoribonuclease L-PSP [Dokdonia sp. MED134]